MKIKKDHYGNLLEDGDFAWVKIAGLSGAKYEIINGGIKIPNLTNSNKLFLYIKKIR